jgi:outer membrane protein assembly factor BamB
MPMKHIATAALTALVTLLVTGVASAATVTLHDTKGPPTATFTATGAGFTAGEAVTFSFAPGGAHTVSAGGDGSAVTTFTAPASTVPGKYPVTATGATSAQTASAVFLVRTNWAQARFGERRAGVNPFENLVNPTNVSSLTTVFEQSCGAGASWQTPTVASGRVYVGSRDGAVCAINKATGRALWTTWTHGEFRSPIAAAYTKLYLTSGRTVQALDSVTGKRLWKARVQGSTAQSSPVAYRHTIYVGSKDGFLYAYAADGCGGRNCAPLWRGWVGRQVLAAPTAVDGSVLVTAADGTIVKFAAAGCGAPVCRPVAKAGLRFEHGHRHGRHWDWRPRALTGALAVVDGKVYAGSTDGQVRVLSLADLTELAHTRLPGRPRVSSPAVLGDVLFVTTSDGRLQALDPATLAVRWTAPLVGGPLAAIRLGGPSVANGVVYAGDRRGGTEAFAAAGCGTAVCAPLWRSAEHGGASAAISDGRVYTGSQGGIMAYALPF